MKHRKTVLKMKIFCSYCFNSTQVLRNLEFQGPASFPAFHILSRRMLASRQSVLAGLSKQIRQKGLQQRNFYGVCFVFKSFPHQQLRSSKYQQLQLIFFLRFQNRNIFRCLSKTGDYFSLTILVTSTNSVNIIIIYIINKYPRMV